MSRWSHADVALLIEWVGMVAPLLCAGGPDDAIVSALNWQMQRDLTERDHPHIGELIEGWSAAMHLAAVEIRQGMR